MVRRTSPNCNERCLVRNAVNRLRELMGRQIDVRPDLGWRRGAVQKIKCDTQQFKRIAQHALPIGRLLFHIAPTGLSNFCYHQEW